MGGHIETHCILGRGRAPEATPVLVVLKYGIETPISIRSLLRVKGDSYSVFQYGELMGGDNVSLNWWPGNQGTALLQ